MSDVEVAQLENQKQGMEHTIRMRDAAERLQKTADWKLVIGQGFCLHEAARYAQESGDPALSATNRADSLALAQASGHLLRFLNAVRNIGNKAEYDMADLENELVKARNGEED